MSPAYRPSQGAIRDGAPRIIRVTNQPVTGSTAAAPSRTRSPGPAKPTTLFKRADVGFGGGEGQEVQLIAEPGYTKQGFLDVPFRMQCPPLDQLSRTMQHNHQTYEVVGGPEGPEQRSRSGGPSLRTVPFKTVFLNWQPSWAIWPTPDAMDPALLEPLLAVAELEELCKRGIRFRLRIGNAALYDHDDVNMVCVLTQANTDEIAGEPDARYLNLVFQEWKPTEIERASVKNTLGPWTHKIVGGDTLYKLAVTYYKTNSLWQLIANANPGMQNGVPPSVNLLLWAQLHHKSSITIPAKPATTVALETAAGTRGIVLP